MYSELNAWQVEVQDFVVHICDIFDPQWKKSWEKKKKDRKKERKKEDYNNSLSTYDVYIYKKLWIWVLGINFS